MASTVVVTLQQRVVSKQLAGQAFIRGRIDITSYDPAAPGEITAITKHFKGTPTVLLGGMSDNFLMVNWDPVAKSVRAAFPTQQTASVGNRAGIEATAAVDVGAVDFVAWGVSK